MLTKGWICQNWAIFNLQNYLEEKVEVFGSCWGEISSLQKSSLTERNNYFWSKNKNCRSLQFSFWRSGDCERSCLRQGAGMPGVPVSSALLQVLGRARSSTCCSSAAAWLPSSHLHLLHPNSQTSSSFPQKTFGSFPYVISLYDNVSCITLWFFFKFIVSHIWSCTSFFFSLLTSGNDHCNRLEGN